MKPTRVLIVYASKNGQTGLIAERIREVAASVEGVTASATAVEKVNENDVVVADVIIAASPVYRGRHDRMIERFIREHQSVLSQRSSALVSVSGAMAAFNGRREAETTAQKFLDLTGWNPDRVALFAGAICYTRYNFIVRWIMKRIAAKQGLDTDTTRDFEYTDWDAVDQFARAFVRAERQAAAGV
jgi:menaquinone-dependent protoporphyrinogen oxidase